MFYSPQLANYFRELFMIEDNEEQQLNSLDINEIIAPLCEIHIHKDAMKASLWLRKNAQGECASLADIKNELLQQGITFGVVSDNILEQLIAASPVNNVIIAEGIYPVHGHDSVFISLLPEIKRENPIIHNENDIVDYRELGDILVVKKGEPILTYSPATSGQPGMNVFGEIVEQYKGINKPLVSRAESTYVNPDNDSELLSKITGQPVFTEEGAYVSPILELKNIDLSTGNIRFNGSIIVKNNVDSGMQVYSSKDIIIEGDVFNARIECLGDIVIKGGVYGKSEIIANGNVNIKKGIQGDHQESNPSVITARIISAGFILLCFAENFVVEAEKNIVVEKYVMNCKLSAEKISVAKAIIGGITWATQLVSTSIIGNNSGVVTKIRSGVNPHIQSAIEELLVLLEVNEKKQIIVRDTLDNNHAPNDQISDIKTKTAKLKFILSELKSEADSYQKELNMLKRENQYPENPKVVISGRIYQGITIQLKKSFWKPTKEISGKTIFTLDALGQIDLSRRNSLGLSK